MKRDLDSLERRRLRAVELFAEDLDNSEIGRRLKVCNQTISRWRKQFASGGKQALAKAGRAGRKPSLNADELDTLVQVLRRGPEVYGYETPLWTCARVGRAIDQEFGIDYHPGHVWKILRKVELESPVARRTSDRAKRSGH